MYRGVVSAKEKDGKKVLAFILKENFKQIDEKYQQKIDEIEDDL